jgi:hypothetical protein
MGPKPSQWGSDEQALPPSLTSAGKPDPLHDLAGPGQGTAGSAPSIANLDALFDHTSDTEAQLPGASSTVSWQFPQPRTVAMYTLTSAAHTPAPSGWTLEASDDGQHWTVLDTRKDERFPWARQTRAFDISQAGAHRYYRFHFNAGAPRALAEIGLLGH